MPPVKRRLDRAEGSRLRYALMTDVSKRMLGVQSPVIPVVGTLVRDNPGTISLGQGIVHYPPPTEAVEAAAACTADPANHIYRAVDGIPALRNALRAKLADDNGLVIGDEHGLHVCAGGNMAFMNGLLAIADPGNEIILPTPYYFNHEMATVMASCTPITVATDSNYMLQPDAIAAAITPRTRAVVTVSPNNPSGAVYPEEMVREVNRICRDNGLYHIHDEAYEYFTYGAARHFSPGSIQDAAPYTISLYSLSKAYGMAGWRMGYMVYPAHLHEAIRKIQDTILICPPIPSQYAALAALGMGRAYCENWLEEYAEVRTGFKQAMASIDNICDVPNADGAFYFLLRVHTDMDAMTLVQKLVLEHAVAAIPGSAFGLTNGCYLRVAYGALRKDSAIEGVQRLTTGLRALVSSSNN